MDQFKILLQAALDLQKSQNEVNSQIKQIKTEALKLGIEVDNKSAKQAIKEMSVEAQKALDSNKKILDNRISTYLKDNTKLSADYRNKLLGIKDAIVNVDKVGLGTLKKEFREVTSSAEALGQTGASTFDKLGKNVNQFVQYLGAATIVMQGIRLSQDIVSTVFELDKSIVGLQMATGDTNEQAKELMKTYIDLGQQLGATGTEVANSAGEWLRQGKSIAETNELIKDSMILSKIGQIDSAQATELLTSAMKGYKVEVFDVIGIVDKLSAVDMSSATDVEGLATAMSRVASMAEISGVSMDKLLGYLAVVGETTKKDMASVGESFQTIFSRMGNIKIGKMIDDDGESLNDVEKVLNNLDIKLRDSKDSFRDFSDVLDDIGEKWGTLSETEQNALGVAIAGTRQRENFVVLMQNYSKSLEYTGISAESAGTAMEKFAAYEDSLESRTKKLQDSFQKLANDTLDSSVVKSFLDLANGLVIVTDKVGLFNTIIGIAGVFALVKFYKSLDILKLKSLEASGMLAGLTTAEIANASSTVGLTAALDGLKIAFMSNPLFLAGTVAVGLFAFKSLIDQNVKSSEELIEKINNLKNETKSLQDEYDNLSIKPELIESEKNRLGLLQAQIEANKILIKQETEKAYAVYQAEQKTKTTSDNAYAARTGTKAPTPLTLDINRSSVSDMIEAYQKLEETKAKDIAQDNKIIAKKAELKGALAGAALTLESYKESGVELNESDKKYLDTIYKITSAVTDKDNEIKESSENISESISSIFADENFSKSIDTFQTNMNSISKALESISNEKISSSDIIDLMQQFPQLSDYGFTGSEGVSALSTALKFLASDLYKNSDASLKSNKAFKQMYLDVMSADNAVISLSASIKSMQDVDGLIRTVNKEMKDMGSISSETLISIAEKYPKLESLIAEYNSGLASSGDIIGALTDVYKQDEKNFRIANKAKLEQSESFYTQVYDKIPDYIKNLAKSYDLDLSNYKSVALAKADINNKLVSALSKAWEDAGGDNLGDVDQQRLEQRIMRQPNIVDLFSLSDSINNVSAGLQTDINITTPKSSKSNTKEKKESTFSNQIDWAKISVDKLQDAVSKYQDTLDDTKPYSAQIKDITNLISLQNKLNTGYKKQAETYEKEYKSSIKGLDQKYIDKISKGGTFTIQDFAGKSKGEQEKLYNQITKAQSVYDQWQESLDNAKDLTKDIAENTQKIADLNIEVKLEPFVNKAKELDDTLNEISQAIGLVDENSIEQIQLYQSGYNTASKAVANLNKEINALNKAYAGNTKDEDYKTRLADLKSQLYENSNAMKSYQDSIISAMKARYDDQSDLLKKSLDDELDSIEKVHKEITDRLKDQLDAYKKIIDAKKESLRTTEDEYQYQKKLAEHTKDISKITDRMAELQKAANSGDREAAAEIRKLQDELADAQSDLDDTQHDRKVELEEDTLDKAYNEYQDMINKQIDLADSAYENDKANSQKIYDDKMEKITTLYENEKQLIAEAAALTSSQFSEVFAKINSQLAEYGLSMSSGLSGAINTTNTGLSGVGSGIGVGASKGSGSFDSIKNLLQNGSSSSGDSELNKYIHSKYGSYLTFAEMAQLANMLGVSGINGASDVQGNSTNRTKILNALKSAKYGDGGMLDAGDINSSIKGMGEDFLFVGKRKESVLKEDETKAYQKVAGFMPDIVSLISSGLLNSSNYTTNTNNSPSFEITIPISGNADTSTVNGLKSATKDIVNQVSEVIMKKMRIS
jgi:TP901 family phage tail tape measure protein